MTERIMAHLVAGFPDRACSLEAARALLDGGCAALEVQLPFSDPTADGPWIQRACDAALRAGLRVDDGLRLVEEIARLAPVPVFIMSYANLVFVRGVERFLREAKQAGACGLIVPDLPVDADEGLYALGRKAGLAVVPVVPAGVRPERLRRVGATGAEYLYVALRPGITGAYTAIGEDNLAFLRQVSALGMKLIAGFGVSSRDQVQALAPYVHLVVVGSAFIREILNRGEGVGVYDAVRARLRTFAGPAGR